MKFNAKICFSIRIYCIKHLIEPVEVAECNVLNLFTISAFWLLIYYEYIN